MNYCRQDVVVIALLPAGTPRAILLMLWRVVQADFKTGIFTITLGKLAQEPEKVNKIEIKSG